MPAGTRDRRRGSTERAGPGGIAARHRHRRSNPLRDPSDRRLPRVPEPCALVVFGVTGDLARKKLLPAIYDLANRGLLPADFVLLGLRPARLGRRRLRGAGQEGGEGARPHPVERGGLGAGWPSNIQFVPGSFDDDDAFDTLAETLDDLRNSHGIKGNAAFYLSIPPAHVPDRAQADGAHRNGRQRAQRRLAPGRGREAVRARPGKRARAEQAGRRRVHGARTSSASTTTWARRPSRTCWRCGSPTSCSSRSGTRNFVDSVQITMAEDVGIGGRAAFYDATGAARDVLQNHLLQLLALTAMEEPVEFAAEAIRTEKIKVLRAITPAARPRRRTPSAASTTRAGWPASAPRPTATRRASRPDSKTETYAAVRLGVETRRWAGVPFYLRTGKRLPRRVTEIAVLFKKAPHLPFSQTDTQELGHNQLVIRVQPDEGVTLKFGSKVPGSAMEVRDVSMDFLYGEAFTESSPEAYERLILDVLLGDATLFPRNDEVEASWRVIDPLEEFWAGKPPYLYRAGEWGPKEADEMLARDGREWRRP